MQFLFPAARRRPITAYGGSLHPAWFDVNSLPVSASSSFDPQGLRDAIDEVHQIIQMLADRGVPSTRIVLGGFSQGGFLAIEAAHAYHSSLGGVVSISGWCHSTATCKTPFFFSCGSADEVVDFNLSKASGERLAASSGGSAVIVHVQVSLLRLWHICWWLVALKFVCAMGIAIKPHVIRWVHFRPV